MATTQEGEPSNTPRKCFLRAAHFGDLEKLQALLKEGIPVDSANEQGLQALHLAAKSGNADVVDELIQAGADVDAVTSKGNTALHVSALAGRTDVVKVLLRNKAQVNLQSDYKGDKFTPLYMASQIGHQEIVTLLLASGADPTIATSAGFTPKVIALQQGFQALAELLDEYEKRTKGSPSTTPTPQLAPEIESEIKNRSNGSNGSDASTPEAVVTEAPVTDITSSE